MIQKYQRCKGGGGLSNSQNKSVPPNVNNVIGVVSVTIQTNILLFTMLA